MSDRTEVLRRLRQFNDGVAAGDRELAEHTEPPRPEGLFDALPALDVDLAYESIVLRRRRPVLAIQRDDVELVFADREDVPLWHDRLTRARGQLQPGLRAVGRIDVIGHRLQWLGTGWLVADDVMVTNRHVAVELASGSTLRFRIGDDDRPLRAAIDFRRELGPGLDRASPRAFAVVQVLHIEPEGGPDLAFFRVEPTAGSERLAAPIALATTAPALDQAIAVIGYPAHDSRIPEAALMAEIFGGRYDGKRLAPGRVTRVEDDRVLHDCTTLGGNSGSAVIDLATGQAVGLHFSGAFLAHNYAVRADLVQARLTALRGQPRVVVGVEQPAASAQVVRLTVPITISIAVGGAVTATTVATAAAGTTGSPAGDR